MSKVLKFKEGDKVVINTKSTDLSPLNEKVAEILYVLHESKYNDYKIKYLNDLGSISTVKVKENEIQEIKDELILQLELGQKVIYTPLDMTVTIEQINLIYGQVAVRFSDGGVSVVGIENIKKINEGEKMDKEFKFNIGDKVRTKTKDEEWIFKDGVITSIKAYKRFNEYKVSFGDCKSVFGEKELELISEFGTDNELKVREESSVGEHMLNAFLGHYKIDENTYAVPKQLLINLIESAYEE